VLIRFKILERGDGGTVQLIYAGSRSTRIELSGIVEGQGGARNLSPELLERDESPVERYRAYLRAKTVNLAAAGLMAVGFVGLSIYIARDIRRDRTLNIPVPKGFIVLWR